MGVDKVEHSVIPPGGWTGSERPGEQRGEVRTTVASRALLATAVTHRPRPGGERVGVRVYSCVDPDPKLVNGRLSRKSPRSPGVPGRSVTELCSRGTCGTIRTEAIVVGP